MLHPGRQDRHAGVGSAAPAFRPGSPANLVRLFEHEPDLLAGVDAHSAQVLRERYVARVIRLEPGQWHPVSPSPEEARGALGLLVIHGALVRYVHLDGRPSPELVMNGDLLRPWDPGVEVEQTAASSWRVLTPTELAVLDARFVATVARWPTITSQLVSRALQRSRMLAFLHAVAQTRRAEDRMLILLRLLGDRCGKVTPEGVVIPLPLTHEVLGELVCVRRPTASTALGQLRRAGLIQRRPDRTWLVRRQCAADGSPVAA